MGCRIRRGHEAAVYERLDVRVVAGLLSELAVTQTVRARVPVWASSRPPLREPRMPVNVVAMPSRDGLCSDVGTQVPVGLA